MPIKKRAHHYSADFKTQAVQLAISSGKSQRVAADELGVGMSTLSEWVSIPNAAQTISPITGLTTQQAFKQEVRRLKRKNEISRHKREILKAATRFFMKENQRNSPSSAITLPCLKSSSCSVSSTSVKAGSTPGSDA